MKQLIVKFTFLLISISIMAQTTVKSYDRLTDEAVGTLCHAAKLKSSEMGLDISFAICDTDGLPRLFCRFGDALVLSTILVPGGIPPFPQRPYCRRNRCRRSHKGAES